jgi:hypothetical protein
MSNNIQLTCDMHDSSVSGVCLNSNLNSIARVLDILIIGAQTPNDCRDTLIELLDTAVKIYRGNGALTYTNNNGIYVIDREQDKKKQDLTPCGRLTFDTGKMTCRYAGSTGNVFFFQGSYDFDESSSLSASNAQSFIKFVKDGLKKMSL